MRPYEEIYMQLKRDSDIRVEPGTSRSMRMRLSYLDQPNQTNNRIQYDNVNRSDSVGREVIRFVHYNRNNLHHYSM